MGQCRRAANGVELVKGGHSCLAEDKGTLPASGIVVVKVSFVR